MRARATSRGDAPHGRRLADHAPSRRAPTQGLSDEAIELIAERLRVIAEPNRIRILGVLDEGDATVQEITDRLMTTHQNVSKHLGILYRAGMVSRRKEGISVRYALVDWTGSWLVEQMAGSVADRIDELQQLFAPGGDHVA